MEYIKKLYDLRTDHDYSQQHIATILKTTQQQYSKYEKGIQELPIRHLITLSKLYNVSTDYILGLDTAPNRKENSAHITVNQRDKNNNFFR